MNQMKNFNRHSELDQILHRLGLNTFRAHYQHLAESHDKAEKGHLSYLYELAQQEAEDREIKKKNRLLKSARMPRHKTLHDFEINKIPGLSKNLIERLAIGAFMDTAVNLLIFGNPGTGKTHLCIALAREWCLMGRRVLYRSASQIVEELKKAQTSNSLHAYIKQLDRIDCLILDDISYIPWDKQDTALLFQLISERYEQRSLVITSNLPFSKWETFFPDKITAVAAIDRLVHHSEILELNAPSYRKSKAKKQREEI